MSSPSEQGGPGRGAVGHQLPVTAPSFPQVPPPPAEAVAEGPQRLHPAVLGVWALSGVRALVLLLVAGSFNIYAALVFALVAAVSAVARWLRFEWHVDGSALVIEQGVIQRQRRVIPLERIQSVEVVRKLGHRVFGVVELRVESIGGGSTEGQLDALDPRLAHDLRRQLLRRGKAGGAAPPPQAPTGGQAGGQASEAEEPAPELVRMRPTQLVVAGITGGRVGVFAAIVGFASQAAGERVAGAVEWLLAFVGATETTGVLMAALIVAAAALVVAFVLSVIATTLTFWDFRLTKDRRNLYTARGLLDQRSGTIPLHRVQSVRVEENLVRRWLGLAAVKVEVAGHAGGGDGQETSTVMPLGRRSDAVALAGTILGRPDAETATAQPMPGGARDRRFVRAAFATVILTAPAVWWFGPLGLTALGLALPFSLLALAAYRALGHAESDGLLLARSGVLVRTTHFTLERALQAVSVNSSPFQRRRGLATLVLHIARSPSGGGDPTVIDVTERHARAELWRLADSSDKGARRPASHTAGPTVRVQSPSDAAAVEALRDEDADAAPSYEAELSLVAEEDGEILGHAPLSRVAVGERPADGMVHLLGPVAVHPDRRDQGLEALLVKASLAASAQRGAHRLVARGDPELFKASGFEPLEAHGMQAPTGDSGPWLVRLLPADEGRAQGQLAAHPA